MNQIKIPESFSLLGREIKVEYDEKLIDRENIQAFVSYRQNKIVLQPNGENVDRFEGSIEICFLHELTHFICEVIGEDKLRQDEQFVDLFANLLYQAFKTAKYKD